MSSRSSLLVLFAGVLWGTSGLIATWLDHLGWPAPAAAEARLAVAALVLVPARRSANVGRRRVLAVGAGLAVYQYAYFAALPRIGVALATLIAIGAAPLLTALLAREPLTGAVRCSMPLSLVGLGLLCAAPAPHGPAATALGCVLALLSAAGYAGVTVVVRTAGPAADPIGVTRAGMAVGALLLLLPVLFAPGLRPDVAALTDPRAWLLAGYVGAVPTALAYVAYCTGLRHTDATTATVLTLVEPVVAAALAVGLLGEPFGLRTAAGAAAVCAAVAVTIRPRSARTARRR